ncbi:glycosyltransferase [Candidatus Woesearchaeota archaeon]|nr:glycosyltransferase [Candidatus Woesearchaeota archaeon]
MIKKQSYIYFLGTYPPRKCGIATFTYDLSSAFNRAANPKLKSKIGAMNDNNSEYNYDDRVMFQINDADAKEYIIAANEINNDENTKLVSVQHEFKIFGSDYGENLLSFLETLKKPVATTLHTVLPYPSEHRRDIIRAIANHSNKLVVMSNNAVDILKEHYNIDESKIEVIPHGIHKVEHVSNLSLKEELGYSDRDLITSFGFLRPGRGTRSSGRGYEYVIDAMPDIVEKYPNVLYLIIGVTHPKYLKSEGESYREFLQNKVIELGLEKNVKFINKYVTLRELFRYLQATDIYICSSLNPDQIVSGTLSYAMGCGCAVISTPFLYAKEFISPEQGILLDDFGEPELISNAVIKLLSDSDLRSRLGQNAYNSTRHMLWRNVAKSYKKVFESII